MCIALLRFFGLRIPQNDSTLVFSKLILSKYLIQKSHAFLDFVTMISLTIKNFRANLITMLGITNPSTDVQYRTISTEGKGAYDQLLIEYEGYEEDIIPAYLLIPKGNGPFPAVLIHHQHNSEWHLGKSEVCGIKGDPYNAFGPELAKNGIIVLAPDSVGFEDRRRNQKGTDKNEKTDSLQYFNGMAYRMVHGKLLMTTVLNDAVKGINLLNCLSMVDANNIGIMGHSYGGNTSIFHAAIDERIRFTCASGSACSYKNKIANETGIEMSLIIPGILNSMDISDIVKCISPRKILIVSATDDIYSKDATDIVNKVRKELKESNEIDNVEHKHYEGSHALTAERFEFIIDWVRKQALVGR